MAKKKQVQRKPMKPTKRWAIVSASGRYVDEYSSKAAAKFGCLWKPGNSVRRVLITEV